MPKTPGQVAYSPRVPRHSMLYWLAKTCREARIAAGCQPIQIAVLVRPGPVDAGTITRFEEPRAWPRHPDAFVDAYAEAADVDPAVLWLRASLAWCDHLERPLIDPRASRGPEP